MSHPDKMVFQGQNAAGPIKILLGLMRKFSKVRDRKSIFLYVAANYRK